jgi:hypothetical protein
VSKTSQFTIDGRIYRVTIIQQVRASDRATRIIVPTYIMNDTARNMVRVCVACLQRFTDPAEAEIWLVDNNSPLVQVQWLQQFNNGINLVLNHTEPVNPLRSLPTGWRKWRLILQGKWRNQQMWDGSYANAIALEIGCRAIAPTAPEIFVMHCDALPTKAGWLNHLRSKMDDRVRAVACHGDRQRINALHVSGLLVDYALFQSSGMSFLPNINQERFPELPEYDVGDDISIKLRAQGLSGFVLPNTHNEAALVDKIPAGSPFQAVPTAARCFDDEWHVIYMHMGRGTVKSAKLYHREGKTYPQQWIELIETKILRNY